METKTGARLRVMAVTCMDMLKSSSATWPWLSPNGPSGSSRSGSINPSITISASAGTSRSTVTALAIRIRPPARHRHLVEIERELHGTGEHHHRGAADHDAARHRLLALAVFAPVGVAA